MIRIRFIGHTIMSVQVLPIISKTIISSVLIRTLCIFVMRLINKKNLEKLKRKNKGNSSLVLAIDKLIKDIDENNWRNQAELKATRPDADSVHSDGFYFFNISVYRTMILIEFDEDEASVVWSGSHQEYETTFKNNRNTIKKWLKSKDWI